MTFLSQTRPPEPQPPEPAQACAGKQPRRRWLRWLAGVGLVGLLVAVFGFLTAHWLIAFPSPTPARTAADTPSSAAGWWNNPAPLTDDEICYQRWLSSITWQLPPERWNEHWNIGGRQFDINSIRYHAAFAGYAAAALGMRTPAYPTVTGRILRDTLEKLIDRHAWRYIDAYWGDKPWFPDPCGGENVMYTGHLLQLAALYEAATGDPHYRTQGFDLIWDDRARVHYDTLKLVEVTVRQMRANDCGGIACEPGLVFMPCNNHPHVTLRILEGMGLGDWAADRAKWESWALSSYRSVLGGGAVRLLYHLPSKIFVPRGHLGLDGWSILWLVPWVSDPTVARKIWDISARKIDWAWFEKEDGHPPADKRKRTDCCDVINVPPACVASFLAPAARVCGDTATATRLEGWLDRRFRKEENGKAWLDADPAWRIGITANRLLSLALANQSDIRRLVLAPLPRDYFKGPLLLDVEPADAPVYQAYRSGADLVIEIDGGANDARLRLGNVPAIGRVEGVPVGQWSYYNGVLTLTKASRLTLKITPARPR